MRKFSLGICLGSQFLLQGFDRIVDAFQCEPECPEVHAYALARLQVQMRLNRFGGIHVNGLHEPARFVCADWQQREINGPQALANLVEVRPIPCVSGEEDTEGAGGDDEAAPQRSIAVERASS